MSEEDGGPAFPLFLPAANGCGPAANEGMSIRAYFAAHAPDPPRGWIGDGDESARLCKMLGRTDNDIHALIEWRLFYADALIAALKEDGE
jgi:hypothetical protein